MNLVFNSTEELGQVAPMSADLTFSKIRGQLLTAQQFVAGFIGQELMNMALTNQGGNPLTALVRVPVAHLALMKFTALTTASISDQGLLRVNTTDQKDAFEWQHNAVQTALQAQAWDGLENLLAYIEANLSTYPAYTQSVLYTQNKTYLIQNANTFEQFYSIGNSRLVFSTIQPALREAERRRIRPILGAERHAELLGTNLTPAQVELLEASRQALVYATMHIAIRQRQVEINERGVQVRGISQFSSLNYSQPASDKQLQSSVQFFDQQAGELIDKVSQLTKALTGPAPPRPNPIQGSAIVGF